MSPTQRTLDWLRKWGYTAAVVEKWNPHARIRQDLFGFIDVVALSLQQNGVLGIQSTSYSNHPARVRKVLESDIAKQWVSAGNRLWVQSWRKVKGRWLDRVTEFFPESFSGDIHGPDKAVHGREGKSQVQPDSSDGDS